MKKQKDYTDRQLAAFGKRLKQIRKDRGYTNYEQFAFEHNIGRAQYGRYEKGSDLRLSSLLRLLKALELDPVEFFSEGFDFEKGSEQE